MPKTLEHEIEQTETEHSMLRLALAVIISPKDAFEEILRRQLLMQGIIITTLSGLLFTGSVLYKFYYLKQGSLFVLAGGSNPAGAVGMIIINAFILSRAAKLLQDEGDFIRILTALAWSNCITIPLALVSLFQPLMTVGAFGSLWAIAVMVVGVQQAQKVTIWKAIGYFFISAVVVSIVVLSASRFYLDAFYPIAASQVTSQAANTIPYQIILAWLITAVLITAAKFLPRLTDGIDYNNFITIALAALSLSVAVALTSTLNKVDPVQEVVKGVAAYQNMEIPEPSKAIKHFKRELSFFPDDPYVNLYVAHALLASGDYKEALAQYETAKKVKPFIPYAQTGIGSVRYMEGKYGQARKDFEKAAKDYPYYEEPHVRLALVYIRLGKTADAVKAAEKAVDINPRNPLSHIALAQAHTLAGNIKDADEAIAEVKDLDEQLAKKVSFGPDGWEKAIERLTPLDLRPPLKLPTGRKGSRG